MKKVLTGLVFCLIIFGGCSNSKPSAETKIDQTSGVYDYISGTTNLEIKKVELISENGNKSEGQVEGTKFQASTPALINDQEVNLKIDFTDGQELSKKIKLEKRYAIDSYESFAEKMNPLILISNGNAKTQFPISHENGIDVIASENGVSTSVNIQDDQLIGLSVTDEGKDINKELPAILACFQTEYNVTDKGVIDAYNNVLDSKKRTSFTSGEYKFLFEYNDDKLFADITKIH